MGRFFVILFLFACSIPISARKTADRDDVIRLVDSLLVATQKTMRDVDIEKTKELSSKALALSDEIKYYGGQIRSCYVMGQALFHSQNFNQALSYLSRTDKIKDKEKHPLYMTQIYKVKGQIFFYMKMYNQAAEAFNRALKTVVRIEQSDYREYLTCQIYESYIIMYNSSDDVESADNYLQSAIQLLESSQNEPFLYSGMINIYTLAGKQHLHKNEPDSAMLFLNRAMKLADKYSFNYKSFTLRLTGDVFMHEQKFSQALEKYFEALDNAQELGLKGEYATLNGDIARAYQKLKLPDSATYYDNRKQEIENELLKEKVSSTDNALKILIESEHSSTKSEQNKLLITIVLVTLMPLLVIFWFIWKKRKRKIIHNMEMETNLLKQKLNTAFDEVVELAKKNDPMFVVRFSEVYPDFWIKLLDKYPNLTPAEQQLCALTYLNFSTKQIAEFSHVQVRSVQTRRSRLRKSINIDGATDLRDHLIGIEKNSQ